MKKFVSSVLLTMTIGNAVAGEHFCEKVYSSKIKSINKAGDVVMVGMASATAAGFAGAFLTLGFSTIATTSANFNLWSYGFFQVGPELKAHRISRSVLRESTYSREEYLKLQQENYETMRDFQQQHPQIDASQYFNETVTPYLRGKTPYQNPYDINLARTWIDSLTEKLNKGSARQYTRDEVSDVLSAHTTDDLFCPEGKPLKVKSLINVIKAELK